MSNPNDIMRRPLQSGDIITTEELEALLRSGAHATVNATESSTADAAQSDFSTFVTSRLPRVAQRALGDMWRGAKAQFRPDTPEGIAATVSEVYDLAAYDRQNLGLPGTTNSLREKVAAASESGGITGAIDVALQGGVGGVGRLLLELGAENLVQILPMIIPAARLARLGASAAPAAIRAAATYAPNIVARIAPSAAGIGAVAGAAAGIGGTSFFLERGSSIIQGVMDKIEEMGVDPYDPATKQAVIEAISQPEVWEQIKSHATDRAAIIGLIDGITTAVGARLALRGKTLSGVALDVAGGGGGEALAQQLTEGGIRRPGEVVLEGVGELIGVPTIHGAHVYPRRRQPEPQQQPPVPATQSTETPAAQGAATPATQGAATPTATTTQTEPQPRPVNVNGTTIYYPPRQPAAPTTPQGQPQQAPRRGKKGKQKGEEAQQQGGGLIGEAFSGATNQGAPPQAAPPLGARPAQAQQGAAPGQGPGGAGSVLLRALGVLPENDNSRPFWGGLTANRNLEGRGRPMPPPANGNVQQAQPQPAPQPQASPEAGPSVYDTYAQFIDPGTRERINRVNLALGLRGAKNDFDAMGEVSRILAEYARDGKAAYINPPQPDESAGEAGKAAFVEQASAWLQTALSQIESAMANEAGARLSNPPKLPGGRVNRAIEAARQILGREPNDAELAAIQREFGGYSGENEPRQDVREENPYATGVPGLSQDRLRRGAEEQIRRGVETPPLVEGRVSPGLPPPDYAGRRSGAALSPEVWQEAAMAVKRFDGTEPPDDDYELAARLEAVLQRLSRQVGEGFKPSVEPPDAYVGGEVTEDYINRLNAWTRYAISEINRISANLAGNRPKLPALDPPLEEARRLAKEFLGVEELPPRIEQLLIERYGTERTEPAPSGVKEAYGPGYNPLARDQELYQAGADRGPGGALVPTGESVIYMGDRPYKPMGEPRTFDAGLNRYASGYPGVPVYDDTSIRTPIESIKRAEQVQPAEQEAGKGGAKGKRPGQKGAPPEQAKAKGAAAALIETATAAQAAKPEQAVSKPAEPAKPQAKPEVRPVAEPQAGQAKPVAKPEASPQPQQQTELTKSDVKRLASEIANRLTLGGGQQKPPARGAAAALVETASSAQASAQKTAPAPAKGEEKKPRGRSKSVSRSRRQDKGNKSDKEEERPSGAAASEERKDERAPALQDGGPAAREVAGAAPEPAPAPAQREAPSPARSEAEGVVSQPRASEDRSEVSRAVEAGDGQRSPQSDQGLTAGANQKQAEGGEEKPQTLNERLLRGPLTPDDKYFKIRMVKLIPDSGILPVMWMPDRIGKKLSPQAFVKEVLDVRASLSEAFDAAVQYWGTAASRLLVAEAGYDMGALRKPQHFVEYFAHINPYFNVLGGLFSTLVNNKIKLADYPVERIIHQAFQLDAQNIQVAKGDFNPPRDYTRVDTGFYVRMKLGDKGAEDSALAAIKLAYNFYDKSFSWAYVTAVRSDDDLSPPYSSNVKVYRDGILAELTVNVPPGPPDPAELTMRALGAFAHAHMSLAMLENDGYAKNIYEKLARIAEGYMYDAGFASPEKKGAATPADAATFFLSKGNPVPAYSFKVSEGVVAHTVPTLASFAAVADIVYSNPALEKEYAAEIERDVAAGRYGYSISTLLTQDIFKNNKKSYMHSLMRAMSPFAKYGFVRSKPDNSSLGIRRGGVKSGWRGIENPRFANLNVEPKKAASKNATEQFIEDKIWPQHVDKQVRMVASGMLALKEFAAFSRLPLGNAADPGLLAKRVAELATWLISSNVTNAPPSEVVRDLVGLSDAALGSEEGPAITWIKEEEYYGVLDDYLEKIEKVMPTSVRDQYEVFKSLKAAKLIEVVPQDADLPKETLNKLGRLPVGDFKGIGLVRLKSVQEAFADSNRPKQPDKRQAVAQEFASQSKGDAAPAKPSVEEVLANPVTTSDTSAFERLKKLGDTGNVVPLHWTPDKLDRKLTDRNFHKQMLSVSGVMSEALDQTIGAWNSVKQIPLAGIVGEQSGALPNPESVTDYAIHRNPYFSIVGGAVFTMISRGDYLLGERLDGYIKKAFHFNNPNVKIYDEEPDRLKSSSQVAENLYFRRPTLRKEMADITLEAVKFAHSVYGKSFSWVEVRTSEEGDYVDPPYHAEVIIGPSGPVLRLSLSIDKKDDEAEIVLRALGGFAHGHMSLAMDMPDQHAQEVYRKLGAVANAYMVDAGFARSIDSGIKRSYKDIQRFFLPDQENGWGALDGRSPGFVFKNRDTTFHTVPALASFVAVADMIRQLIAGQAAAGAPSDLAEALKKSAGSLAKLFNKNIFNNNKKMYMHAMLKSMGGVVQVDSVNALPDNSSYGVRPGGSSDWKKTYDKTFAKYEEKDYRAEKKKAKELFKNERLDPKRWDDQVSLVAGKMLSLQEFSSLPYMPSMRKVDTSALARRVSRMIVELVARNVTSEDPSVLAKDLLGLNGISVKEKVNYKLEAYSKPVKLGDIRFFVDSDVEAALNADRSFLNVIRGLATALNFKDQRFFLRSEILPHYATATSSIVIDKDRGTLNYVITFNKELMIPDGKFEKFFRENSGTRILAAIHEFAHIAMFNAMMSNAPDYYKFIDKYLTKIESALEKERGQPGSLFSSLYPEGLVDIVPDDKEKEGRYTRSALGKLPVRPGGERISVQLKPVQEVFAEAVERMLLDTNWQGSDQFSEEVKRALSADNMALLRARQALINLRKLAARMPGTPEERDIRKFAVEASLLTTDRLMPEDRSDDLDLADLYKSIGIATYIPYHSASEISLGDIGRGVAMKTPRWLKDTSRIALRAIDAVASRSQNYAWLKSAAEEIGSSIQVRNTKLPNAARRGFEMVWRSSSAHARWLADSVGSTVMREKVIDQITHTPGVPSNVNQTFEEEVDAYTNRFLGQWADVVEKARADGIDDSRLAGLMTGAVTRGAATQAEMVYASRLRAQLDRMISHMKRAGVQVGYVDDYLPRVFDPAKVRRNSTDFISRVKSIYEMIGYDPQEAAAAAQQLEIAITIGEEAVLLQPPKVAGTSPSIVKHRKFPPAADRILADYYDRDIMALGERYVFAAVRKAAIARRWGDRFSDFPAILEEARQELLEKGVDRQETEEFLHLMVDYVRSVLGLSHSTMAWKLSAFFRTLGALALFEKIAAYTISEPSALIARTGDYLAPLRAYVDMSAVIMKRLRQKPDVGVLVAHAVGAISSDLADSFTQHRVVAGGGVGKVMGTAIKSFYRRIYVEQLTNAYRVAATKAAVRFILKAASRSHEFRSFYMLRELGLSKEQIEKIRDYSTKGAWAEADFETILHDIAMGKEEVHRIMAPAVYRFVQDAVISARAGERPRWANTPFGALTFFALSYPYNLARRLSMRPARAYKETKSASFVAPMFVALGASVVMSATISDKTLSVRDYLYASEYTVPIPERMTDWARIERALGATGYFGPTDALLQILSTSRVQMDPSRIFIGAPGSVYLGFVSSVRDYFNANSEKTSTAERKLAQAAWGAFVEPGVNFLLTGIHKGAPGVAATALSVYGLPKLGTFLIDEYIPPTSQVKSDTVYGATEKIYMKIMGEDLK